MMMRSISLSLFSLLLPLLMCRADFESHYEEGDSVDVWIKYLSPRNNAQETYRYDRYFCTGTSSSSSNEASSSEYPKSIADALLGIEPVSLGVDIKFGENISVPVEFCHTSGQQEAITDIVEKHYVLRGSIDGIDFILDVGNRMDQDRDNEAKSRVIHIKAQLIRTYLLC